MRSIFFCVHQNPIGPEFLSWCSFPNNLSRGWRMKVVVRDSLDRNINRWSNRPLLPLVAYLHSGFWFHLTRSDTVQKYQIALKVEWKCVFGVVYYSFFILLFLNLIFFRVIYLTVQYVWNYLKMNLGGMSKILTFWWLISFLDCLLENKEHT